MGCRKGKNYCKIKRNVKLDKYGWGTLIKDNQKLLNRLHVVIDAVVIVFSYIASWYLRFKSGIFELDPWFLSLQEYAKVLIVIVPGYLVLYYGFQLYTPKRVQGRRLEAWHIIQANVIGLMAFILLLYVWKQPDFSRGMILYFSWWMYF